jgi:hypothetical protein
MPTKSKKRKKQPADLTPLESKGSEAITVAWTVTITTLLFCNLAILGAHYFSLRNPEVAGLKMMEEMLLIAGSGLGVLSLGLLPVVYRVRAVAPPTGLAVFGTSLAVAPVLVLLVRTLQ